MAGEPRRGLPRSLYRLGFMVSGALLLAYASHHLSRLNANVDLGCKTAVISDLPSPDGALYAATVTRRCTVGTRETFVSLRTAGAPLDEIDESGRVLVARDDPPITASWS